MFQGAVLRARAFSTMGAVKLSLLTAVEDFFVHSLSLSIFESMHVLTVVSPLSLINNILLACPSKYSWEGCLTFNKYGWKIPASVTPLVGNFSHFLMYVLANLSRPSRCVLLISCIDKWYRIDGSACLSYMASLCSPLTLDLSILLSFSERILWNWS